MFRACILWFLIWVSLFSSAYAQIEFPAHISDFPYDVKRTWRFLPDKTITGYLYPNGSKDFEDSNPIYRKTYDFIEEGADQPISYTDKEIHPADLAWIEFAGAHRRLLTKPFTTPTVDEVKLPEDPGDRARFPLVIFPDFPESKLGMSHILPTYAGWWQATGFLPWPTPKTPKEIVEDRVNSTREGITFALLSSNQLEHSAGAVHSFLKTNYKAHIGVSLASIPYVDSRILQHYANSDDLLLLGLTIRSSGQANDTRNIRTYVGAVLRADSTGLIDLIFQGRPVRVRLKPEEAKDPTLDIGWGAKELELVDTSNASALLKTFGVRVFINPIDTQPLWVYRLHRFHTAKTDVEVADFIIPPPQIVEDSSTTPDLSDGKQLSFRFAKEHYQNVVVHDTKREFTPRTWTNNRGKTMQASYTTETPESFARKGDIHVKIRDKIYGFLPQELSKEDRTYVKFAKTDIGSSKPEGHGRLLYRIRKPGQPESLWLELHYNHIRAFAVLQKGETFSPLPRTPEMFEKPVRKETSSDLFLIKWQELRHQTLFSQNSESKIGNFDRASISEFHFSDDPVHQFAAYLASATPAEHHEFPVRKIDLHQALKWAPENYHTRYVYSSFPIPWATGFWKVFVEHSESEFATELKPIKALLDQGHTIGTLPVEILCKHKTDSSASFQLILEEAEVGEAHPQHFDIE